MPNGFMTFFSDPLNLLMFAIAAIAGFKLWQILGQRTGVEPRPTLQSIKTEPSPTDLVLEPVTANPVWQGYAPENSAMANALLRIIAKEPLFNTDAFMANAKQAHEQILEAFAKGDLPSLQTLLTPQTFQAFEKEIIRRKQAGETALFHFIGIKSAKLADAQMHENTAVLVIAFESQIVTAIKDKSGNLISGDEKASSIIKELWTFERDLTGAENSWRLAETHD
jgi:predicted lipid-binding transport protein (Tim44 family)